MEKINIIKITAGMIPECEIIVTNAPIEVVEIQLRINCAREENGKPIDNPYDYVEQKGFTVDCIEDTDFFDEDKIDHFLDWYDYYTK
jgi:hypothetical protein